MESKGYDRSLPWLKPAKFVHAGACGLVAAWVAVACFRTGVPVGFILFWCAGILAAAAAVRFPEVGLYLFVALTYGTPRYKDTFLIMSSIGVSTWLAILAAAGGGLWMAERQVRVSFSDWVSRLMLGLVAWLGVSLLVSLAAGQPFAPHPKHHPQQYLQALLMFVLASHVLVGRAQAVRFTGVLCLTLCARALVTGSYGIYLEGDLSALAVMSLPLAVLGGQCVRRWWARAVFGVLGALMLGLVGMAHNRAAAVGIVALLVVFWLQSRWRWRVLGVAAPVLVMVGAWFVSTDYWQRFEGIWQGTTDRNSVMDRLTIWHAGWRMFLDHPFFGVGPGNFYQWVQVYQPGLAEPYAAHNNFVDVLAEAGAPGLILYGGLITVTLWLLRQTSVLAGREWPGPAARRVLGCLWVYLVVGCFISRHDMALAYLMMGWAVAIRRELYGHGGGIHESAVMTTGGDVVHRAVHNSG